MQLSSPPLARGMSVLAVAACLTAVGLVCLRAWAPAPPLPACAAMVEQEGQLVCAAEAECGAQQGDRVEGDGASCQRRPGGMRAVSRLILGLPLDINRVSAGDLELLEGIGPAKARAIVAFRRERGGIRRLEDLLEVRGIGPKTLERLRRVLRAGSPWRAGDLMP